MRRLRLVAILAVLGIATLVLWSSIYTVSEVEQAIITQFGARRRSCHDRWTEAQGALHPGCQPDRQADSRVGRQSVRYANKGQALHLGRPVRALADRGSPAVLSAAAR